MVEHANSSANLQPVFPFPKMWHIQLHHCWIMIISTIAPFSFPVSFSFQAVPRVATNPAVTRRARPRPVRWSALRCSRCELHFSASSPTWTLKPCWGRPRCVVTGGLWHATPPSGQECCWRMLASLPRFWFFFLVSEHVLITQACMYLMIWVQFSCAEITIFLCMCACPVLVHAFSVVYADPLSDPAKPQTKAERKEGDQGGVSEEHTVLIQYSMEYSAVLKGRKRLPWI